MELETEAGAEWFHDSNNNTETQIQICFTKLAFLFIFLTIFLNLFKLAFLIHV